MIKFDDTSILTGYIKQKLHSFHLPTVDVITKEEEEKETFVKDVTYIKDGKFKIYGEDGEFHNTQNIAYKDLTTKEEKIKSRDFLFYVDQNYPLLTKNLEIRNNRYDSYTHKYLGEYLRFVRDYYNLDLMPLYNCFSNEIVSNLNVNIEINTETEKITTSFNTQDPAYTIYAVPVKFNKTYTIALDSPIGVELVCGFYDKTFTADKELQKICSTSYQKKTQTFFSKPFLFEVKHTNNEGAELEQKNQSNLKLFIKIPFNTKTSIVVLEGDYLGYNDSFLQEKATNTNSDMQYFARYQNHTVANCESGTDLNNFKPISSLQLLRINSGVSHPFSDRLTEYLLEQVITPIDSIDLNINRVQETLKLRGQLKTDVEENKGSNNKIDSTGYYTSWYNEHKNERGFEDLYKDLKPVVGIPDYETKGLWEPVYRVALYDIAVQEKLLNEYNDFLGYVDKDIEQKLKASYFVYRQPNTDPERYTENIDTIIKEGE